MGLDIDPALPSLARSCSPTIHSGLSLLSLCSTSLSAPTPVHLINMSDTMLAARFWGKNDIRLEEIQKPTVQSGQVGISVAWCGICG